MSWRDRKVKGSFEGVEFGVIAVQTGFGRRNAEFRTPFMAGALGQTFGRGERDHEIEAVYTGDNHDLDARRLMDAIERTEIGTLVHPLLGRARVQQKPGTRGKFTYDGSSTTKVTWTVQVVRNDEPDLGEDTAGLAIEALDAAIAAMADDFVEDFSLVEASVYTIDSAVSDTGTMIDDLYEFASDADQILDTPANLIADFDSFTDSVIDLVYTPTLLQRKINNLIGRVLVDVEILGGIVGELYGMLAGTSDQVGLLPTRTAVTTGGIARDKNQRALARTVVAGTALQGGRALVSSVAAGRGPNDAATVIKLVKKVRDMLDQVADLSPNPEAFEAIREAGARLRAWSVSATQTLPRVVGYTPNHTIPLPVLAQLLYGDARRGDVDIWDRNPQISHPLFVPGGELIEVTDG